MGDVKVYLAGSIRDGNAEDIAWRERAIAALEGEPCTIFSPLAGKDYNPETKRWTLYGDHIPDSKYIVHADYWCVERSDLILFDFRSLSTGYASIGTLSEWGRSTAYNILRFVTVSPKQGQANAMFGLHPFLEQHAAKIFTDVDDMIAFAKANIRAITHAPHFGHGLKEALPT